MTDRVGGGNDGASRISRSNSYTSAVNDASSVGGGDYQSPASVPAITRVAAAFGQFPHDLESGSHDGVMPHTDGFVPDSLPIRCWWKNSTFSFTA